MSRDGEREQLLIWIDREHDELVDFLKRFVPAPAPIPRAIRATLAQWLASAGLTARTSAPRQEMANLVASFAGLDVRPVPSLAGPDARLWRQRSMPAFTYGTTATNVAMPDEHTDINEWFGVVKTHTLSALDYLSGETIK